MKNIHFIVHGVPAGHQVWGTQQKQYYESFYGSYEQYGNARSVMVVEARKNGNGRTSYYTFLRCHNVSAFDGRQGSYFGMTLAVDGQYCTDVNSLFHLFEQVFSQKMVGRILTKTGESERFSIEQLSSEDYFLKEMSDLVVKQIGSIIPNEFEDMDETFTKTQASRNVYWNIRDIDCEAFVDATKQYGKVLVSADYSSKDAQIDSFKASGRKASDLQKEHEEVILKMRGENVSLQETVTSLKNILSEKEQESMDAMQRIASLKADVTRLKNEKNQLVERMNDIRRSADVDKIVSRLEPPLMELLNVLRKGQEDEYFEGNRRHDNESRHSKKSSGKPAILGCFKKMTSKKKR